ncbi:competence/damage-inducible protein A [Brevibacillus ruminantium]|uniref:Putative competence-damage inducible protein n=1 Tax=Brevibacillus ruminantium TaxID=2950604 RepID=A0ABY4WRG0_9BACL|nr:competence/damage-inducible protein A [Brevibacillus ruminantium]USG68014.1 competence/damage-inducible protein A [Brevibacillus ruminantium]
MRAEIIAVGTELLLGQIANTNAQFLSQKLAEIGIGVYFHTVVGDNTERLMETIKLAASRSDLVIFSGGLGPTQDDLTKETVASYIETGLVTDSVAMERIEAFFRQRGIVMTQNNCKQALVFDRGVVFPNDTGMAPGMAAEYKGSTFVLLPGPPSELYPMVDRYAMPFFISLLPERQVFHSHVLRFYGIGESALEERLLDLIEGQDNPTIAPYAKEFEVTLRVTARANTVEQAEQLIEPVETEIRKRLGEFIYAEGETSLHEVLVEELKKNGKTIACAESCTGGKVASLITSVPGSSAVMRGGIVCYTNDAKHDLVDIPREVLETDGAISEQTAKLLAENIRHKLGSDCGISVTGVAGPDPSEEKPVGLVYIGVAVDGLPTLVKEVRLAGSRHAIVGRAAKFALFYALQRLKKGERI